MKNQFLQEKNLISTLTQNENFTQYSKVYILMINNVSGFNFFGHRFFNALSMSLKKYWMKIMNCIFFMNYSVQRVQNENFKNQSKQSHRLWKHEITDCAL